MASAMAAAGRDAWTPRGLGWIAPDAGFRMLERLMRSGVAHAAILPIDWQRFAASGIPEAERDYFSLVAAKSAEPAGTPATARGAASITERWRAAPEGQRRASVLSDVRAQALNVLGLPASAELDTRLGLKDAGLDSLMAVELRNMLGRLVGRAFPATLLFDYPSLDALVDHLMKTLGLDANKVPTEPAASNGEAAALAAMSEEEAEAELLAELGQGAQRSVS